MNTTFAVLSLFRLIYLIVAQDLTPAADIKTLSELPLEKLLHVKNSLSFDDIEEDSNEEHVNALDEDEQNLNALALKKAKIKDVKRVDYEDDSKDKGSIQSIFQISVTALAFLAFGGYLVCLITQAVNGKNDNAQQVIVMDSLKRPIRYKRPTNYRNPSTRRPTIHRVRREVWPEANFEKMYEALVSISEGYTNAHTKHFKPFHISGKRI